jgi:UDP-glucose 4-epimerase
MSHPVLVTGGAGFVGSNLARKLLESGRTVTLIDNMSNGKERNIPPGARFIRADLSEDGAYQELAGQKFETIFHIAAQASNAISFREPVRDLLWNQLATLKLLEYARKTGSNRVIFTSSMSAYGQPKRFPTPEDEPLRPDSPYAVHKAASEEYLRIYHAEYGIKYTIFRLYTTYGSEQNLDNLDQGLLSIYLAYLVKKKPIIVKGDLGRKRDIIHVGDVVNALLASENQPSTHGKTFNLCSGVSLSIRELLDELIRRMGFDPATYPVEVQPGTPGDPPITHGTFEHANRSFGFQPKTSPFEGIRLTTEGLSRNE